MNRVKVYTFRMTLIQRSLALLLAGFFVFGILSYASSMAESSHTMANGATHSVCPLMGGTSSACVSVFEHIAHWQSSFAAVLIELLPLALLLASISLGVRFLYRDTWRVATFLFTTPPQFLYSHILLPRHYLQDAFSNGILHSKAH